LLIYSVLEHLLKLKNWSFIGDDAGGISRSWKLAGILTRSNAKLLGFWIYPRFGNFLKRSGVDAHDVKSLRAIHGPSTFLGLLFKKNFMYGEAIILGGDLNFSMGASEVWCPKARGPFIWFFCSQIKRAGVDRCITYQAKFYLKE